MINLLPSEEKNTLKKEEKYRLTFILGTFVLFFLATLSLILFSLKFYLAGEVAGYQILVNFEKQKAVTLEAQNIEKEISLLNQNLNTLATFYENQPGFAEVFKKISNIVPADMYLNTLSLNPSQDKESRFRVSLTGYSKTREILLDFKNRLESESIFQGIYFPPSSWVKPEDINFSASFEIAP